MENNHLKYLDPSIAENIKTITNFVESKFQKLNLPFDYKDFFICFQDYGEDDRTEVINYGKFDKTVYTKEIFEKIVNLEKELETLGPYDYPSFVRLFPNYVGLLTPRIKRGDSYVPISAISIVTKQEQEINHNNNQVLIVFSNNHNQLDIDKLLFLKQSLEKDSINVRLCYIAQSEKNSADILNTNKIKAEDIYYIPYGEQYFLRAYQSLTIVNYNNIVLLTRNKIKYYENEKCFDLNDVLALTQKELTETEVEEKAQYMSYIANLDDYKTLDEYPPMQGENGTAFYKLNETGVPSLLFTIA